MALSYSSSYDISGIEAKSIFSTLCPKYKISHMKVYIQGMSYLILVKFHDLERIVFGPNFKGNGKLLFVNYCTE